MKSRRSSKTKFGGFLLAEVVTALALLGVLIVLVVEFETRASATKIKLEREYIATVAAESQFERLKAGLNVLDSQTFERRYPGFDFDYQVVKSNEDAEPVGMIRVWARKPERKILAKLTCPMAKIAGAVKQ